MLGMLQRRRFLFPEASVTLPPPDSSDEMLERMPAMPGIPGMLGMLPPSRSFFFADCGIARTETTQTK